MSGPDSESAWIAESKYSRPPEAAYPNDARSTASRGAEHATARPPSATATITTLGRARTTGRQGGPNVHMGPWVREERPHIRRCSVFYALTAARRALPALNAGAFEAAIVMGSPVCGFLPCRAARARVENVPNPAMVTASSLARASEMVENTASMTLSTAALDRDASVVICDARSDSAAGGPVHTLSSWRVRWEPARSDRVALRLWCPPAGCAD